MQKINRIVSFFLAGLAVVYTFGYLLWRGLLLTPLYERFWQLQLSEVFGAWSYLPLLPLILVILLARRWRLLLVLALPFAFFAWEYGTQFLPNWQHGIQPKSVQAQAGDENVLRVMTWNTLINPKVQADLQQILIEQPPDIITFQETSYALRRVLEQDYLDLYPYQYSQSYGNLFTVSRYPMKPVLQDSMLRYGCRCLPLELEWQGRTLTVINIHLPSPDVHFSWLTLTMINMHLPSPDVRLSFSKQVPGILQFDASGQDAYYTVLFKLLDELEGPILLQGDINTTERQPHFKQLTQTLVDSFAETGWGFGFTYPNMQIGLEWLVPLVRIDHILHSQELTALTAQTIQLERSDHRAVSATLRWR